MYFLEEEFDYEEEDCDYQEDVDDDMAEFEREVDLKEKRLSLLNTCASAYKLSINQKQDELSAKREKELQMYFQTKKEYEVMERAGCGEKGEEADEEEMFILRNKIIAYEISHNISSSQYNTPDIIAPPKNELPSYDYGDDDSESLDADAFITHGRNISALERYYEEVNSNPSAIDAEYEFWLTFEIRAFEEGSRCISDVEAIHYERMVPYNLAEDMDAHDRLQEEIEYRRAEALEDQD